tara:strand:- start:1084 stop:1401 length:318 start_codon:yes stop_codon:yes gene_type:complete
VKASRHLFCIDKALALSARVLESLRGATHCDKKRHIFTLCGNVIPVYGIDSKLSSGNFYDHKSLINNNIKKSFLPKLFLGTQPASTLPANGLRSMGNVPPVRVLT